MENSRITGPQKRPTPPDWLRRLPTDPDASISVPLEFIERRPTKGDLQLFALLCRLCSRFRTAGTYAWASNMARELKVGVRSVEVALKKFQAWGFVAAEKITLDGEERTMYWCTWLYDDFRKGGFDFGGGVMEPIRDKAFFHAPMAQVPAPGTAPEGSKELKSKKKTTDRGVVVVSSAAPSGEDPPPAPPPLEPKIAELLGREPELAEVEAEIKAGYPSLRARFAVEWIVDAIIVALAARRARKVKGTFVGYVEGILNKSIPNGKVELRGAKPPPRPAAEVESERTREAQADAERRRAEAEARRKGAAVDARIKSLSPAELAGLDAEFDRAHPSIPRPMRSAMRSAWLREAIGEAQEKALPGCPGKFPRGG